MVAGLIFLHSVSVARNVEVGLKQDIGSVITQHHNIMDSTVPVLRQSFELAMPFHVKVHSMLNIYAISRSKIEIALKKPTNDKLNPAGLSKNSNPSVKIAHTKTRENNYENINETTGVYCSAQRNNVHDDKSMGIYFTPNEVLDTSPQKSEATRSHKNNRRKSRYDSNMYALPDSPTGSTTPSSPCLLYTSPSPRD